MLVLALLLFAAPHQPDAKPQCNKHMRGHLWPEEANADMKIARELYRQGVLEMCTVTRSRYGWQVLSLNAKRRRK